MKENRRIYYKKQSIFFTENAQDLIMEKSLSNAWVIRQTEGSQMFFQFQRFIESSFDNLIFEDSPEDYIKKFETHFELIQAGGGVVWNNDSEILMIERLRKWDLPKGKLDPGENIAECAIREVEEETGLENISIVERMKSTYHIYKLHEQWILKETAWYKMKADKQTLIPQAEEDITKAVWVSSNELSEKLSNTYPNIIYLLEGI